MARKRHFNYLGYEIESAEFPLEVTFGMAAAAKQVRESIAVAK